MTNIKAKFNCKETSTYKYVEIPYTGGSTCTVIVFPTNPKDPDKMGAASLLIEVFSNYTSALTTQKV